MTPRFVRLCLAAGLLPLMFDGRAQPPAAPVPAAIPPGNADDPIINEVKLPDADIDTMLSALELYTGRTVLRPTQLAIGPGGFNLRLTTPHKTSEVVTAIQTVLALNNIGVAPLGDKFLIVTNLQLTGRNAPELITGSAYDQPASGKIASKVFQLDFLRVQEVAPMIQQIANPSLGAQAVQFMNANALFVTDSVANLQRIETLLKQVDQPAMSGLRPKFYTLVNGAKASDVVQRIRTIFSGPLLQQLGTGTSFQADDRSNQIILITDPRQYPLFDELIAKLDVRSDPNTRNEVIGLKHALAKDLYAVLGEIIRGQTAAAQRSSSVRPGQPPINLPTVPPNQPPGANVPVAPNSPLTNPAIAQAIEGAGPGSAEFSSVLTIAADERSNSIVASGTSDDLRLLKSLIDKLDTVLAQVRIEVVIAEVSLDDAHTSGISQLGLQVDGDRLVGFNGALPGMTVSGSADGSGFATTSRIGGPGSLGRSLDLSGIISLGTTPRKNNTTVLSVPSITTSHALEAKFISSEIRPITTGSVSTPTTGAANGFQTQEQTVQKDIGITLTVTPLIGSDGSVQLKIDQDVQDIAGTVLVNGNEQPIISHRQTQSTISARSDEIVVIAGMQRNKDSRQTSRLGPIPFLGDLFGRRTKSITRTELIFFLRPHVLTNTEADNAAMIKRIEQLPAKQVPQKDEIHQLIDPKFTPPPKQGVLEKILPRP
jgi:general secretion pathway protein D